MIYVHSDRDPGGYYLFDPKAMRADPLLALRDWIDPTKMAKQKAIFYQTRDGQTIQGFLTLPNGVPAKNLPMVMLPHGGPLDIQDNWGWNPDAQLPASRGYAVLRVTVYYAGVYDLEKWKQDSDVGDSVKGRTYISDFIGARPERLKNASPIHYVDRLKAAVMIVHGTEDQRAPFSQAKALRAALDARHYPYEWLAKSGEGHGLYKPENREELYTRLLAFLDRNIGVGSESAMIPSAPDIASPKH